MSQHPPLTKAAFFEEMARRMTEDSSGRSGIDAGLTYIGQMISHDIVAPAGNKPGARDISPFLNLQSIYSDHQNFTDKFKVIRIEDPSSFVIGYDVNRKKGVADIPEPRNDENVIVSQLHAFWQRFHNQLVCHANPEINENAQALTIKTFQLVVIEDFLANILDPLVFDFYFSQNGHSLLPKTICNAVPDFFSHAAFRFGHSMVRDIYRLQDAPKPELSLAELFNSNNSLKPEQVIDWAKLFSNPRQKARRIDSNVSNIMRHVSFIASSPSDIDVVMKNLEAGEQMGLGSGIEFVNQIIDANTGNSAFDKLGLRPLGELPEKFNGIPGLNSVQDLPLWPYLLCEAELNTGTDNCLGILGSILVGEVLRDAIAGARESVFEQSIYNFHKSIQEMGKLGEALTLAPANSGRHLSMLDVINTEKHMEIIMANVVEKFAGFFAPKSNPDIIQIVNYVEAGDKPIFKDWLPEDGGSFQVRTTLNDHEYYVFMTEKLPTGNWNEQMALASENLVFFPVKSGELMLENINHGIRELVFKENVNTHWRITKWVLKLLEGKTQAVKPTGPVEDTDLICAFIDWENNHGETHQTKYGWEVYDRD